MKWNGRNHIPINANIINRNKKKFDFEEALKPLGKKQLPVWESVVAVNTSVQGPTPFDPSSITGLKLWFDAEDTNTLSLNSGLVESWTSKGDVPLVLTASTSARRPQYITTGGTGSSPAVLMLSSSTVANRSLLTQQNASQSYSLTSGYTIFFASKNTGTKGATGNYGNYHMFFYEYGSSNAAVNQTLRFETAGNIQDNLRTGATTGFVAQYQNPGIITPYYWSGSAYTMKYVGVDYTDMGQYKFYGQDIYSGSPAITSAFWSFQTSYSGKTLNGMGLGGYNYVGTTYTQLSNINQEIYEILVYDRKLSTNDANQVMDYLRGKWDHVVDTSNLAIFDVNYTGKTSNINDNSTFISNTSPSNIIGNTYMGGFGMKYILGNGVDASFVNNLPTVNTGINYTIKDSGNNIIESASCYKSSSTTPITYSAGTYTMDIEINYNCVDPSPTPTPTETLTPSPTPTMTPTPSSAPFDSDAAAYLAAVLSAGGTVDATMSAATNTLFTDLKSNSLYNKLQIFYPFIGGTSASHSIMGNRVSGTTYDINWGGSMTHSVSGVTGVGTTNSWGDTNFFGSGTTKGNRHFSMYSFKQNTTTAYDLSSEENGFILGYGSNSWYGLMDTTNYDPMTASSTTGMYVSTEPSLNTQRNFRNGTNSGNFARTSDTYAGVKFVIGAKNTSPSQIKSERSSRGYNWMSIGLGLSDAEVGNLTTIINTFQTSLSRNTY